LRRIQVHPSNTNTRRLRSYLDLDSEVFRIVFNVVSVNDFLRCVDHKHDHDLINHRLILPIAEGLDPQLLSPNQTEADSSSVARESIYFIRVEEFLDLSIRLLRDQRLLCTELDQHELQIQRHRIDGKELSSVLLHLPKLLSML